MMRLPRLLNSLRAALNLSKLGRRFFERDRNNISLAPASHRYSYAPPKYPLEHDSVDYNTINAIAHRSWVPRFYAPTLAWHRAFWIKNIHEFVQRHPKLCKNIRYNEATPGDNTPASNYINIILDQAILAFFTGLNRLNKLDKQNISIDMFPVVTSTNRVTNIESTNILLFGGAIDADNIRIDSKYRSMSDLSQRERDVLNSEGRVVVLRFTINCMLMVVRVELRGEYFSISTFAQFNDNDIESKLHFTKVRSFDVEHPEKFSEMFLALKNYLSGVNEAIDNEVGDYFYRVFWPDFIGSVIALTDSSEIFHGILFKNLMADFRGIIISNETIGEEMASHKEIRDAEWGYKIDKKLRALLHHTDEYEVTACYGLRNRVLYMSSLGPQPPEYSEKEVIPLEYIVFVQQDKLTNMLRGANCWQLGRFIDRLHLSGSVRLAALKYYPEFLEASAGLERLDFHTSPARHAVSWHRESSRDLIREAHNSFDKITTNFNMKTRTRSGILYRVERSRYYVKQFEESVPALKLSALDGYQKYDDFVKRRLGPAFDFIDRLGGRYERAINSLAALDQYYLSIQSVEFNEVIQEIQRDGELILLLFPVPYYFSMLLEHTLIKPAAEVGTIIIWICSVALAFGRRTNKKSESESSLNGIIEAVRLGSFRKIWASIYARRRPIIVFFSTVIAFGGMSAGFYGAKLCGLLKLQENSVYEESEHPTFCRYVRPDSNDDVTTHVQCDRDGVKNFVTDVPICNNYAGDIGAAQRARNYMQIQRR